LRPARAMALELEVGRSGSIAVVVCRGRIVFGRETTELSKTVRTLLDNSPHIVLDLGAVPTMDSGGLGTLLGLVASARRSGGDLKLCNLSRKVDELLRLTKLSEVVEVFPDQQAALGSFVRS
jgi:anti-sigma B factor antagonist